METLHTKGEWYAKEGQIYPIETGKTLALIPYFDKDNKEQEANAKLIAAEGWKAPYKKQHSKPLLP